MKKINMFLHLYGSLVVYFVMFSLMWVWIGYTGVFRFREPYSFFTRGLISGFVGILGTIFFNVSIWKPDILKDGGK